MRPAALMTPTMHIVVFGVRRAPSNVRRRRRREPPMIRTSHPSLGM